jgi:hypothetical protein
VCQRQCKNRFSAYQLARRASSHARLRLSPWNAPYPGLRICRNRSEMLASGNLVLFASSPRVIHEPYSPADNTTPHNTSSCVGTCGESDFLTTCPASITFHLMPAAFASFDIRVPLPPGPCAIAAVILLASSGSQALRIRIFVITGATAAGTERDFHVFHTFPQVDTPMVTNIDSCALQSYELSRLARAKNEKGELGSSPGTLINF